MRILVSMCLLGVPCRYDGKSRPDAAVTALSAAHELVPVCPEQLGGLPTPRTPAERRGARVVTRDGRDVTQAYLDGAQRALDLARTLGCEAAVLKERSPSCGCGRIYDGTFSGALTDGDGVTAGLLACAGLRVVGESDAWRLAGLQEPVRRDQP